MCRWLVNICSHNLFEYEIAKFQPLWTMNHWNAISTCLPFCYSWSAPHYSTFCSVSSWTKRAQTHCKCSNWKIIFWIILIGLTISYFWIISSRDSLSNLKCFNVSLIIKCPIYHFIHIAPAIVSGKATSAWSYNCYQSQGHEFYSHWL